MVDRYLSVSFSTEFLSFGTTNAAGVGFGARSFLRKYKLLFDSRISSSGRPGTICLRDGKRLIDMIRPWRKELVSGILVVAWINKEAGNDSEH